MLTKAGKFLLTVKPPKGTEDKWESARALAANDEQLERTLEVFIRDNDINAPEGLGKLIKFMDYIESRRRELMYRAPVFDNPMDFLTDPEGMGIPRDQFWPAIREALEDLAPGRYYEAMAVGGIGTGKTHLALNHLVYETHRLVGLRNPHGHFGLDSTSEIVMIFQSITATTAQSVDYDRYRRMIAASPWFKKYGPFDQELKSQVRFIDTNIQVKSISSRETGAIGQNVIGGMIDEINFMQMVEKSARTHDGTLYDQAQANYNAIARRRESRFSKLGDLAGMLWLVSSRRYPGQFTDKKEEEIKRQVREHGKSKIFLYDKRIWEAKPEGNFGPGRFYVFIGDRGRKPFIVPKQDEDKWKNDPLVDAIPLELKTSYENDIYSALRDNSGLSTLAENVYIPNVEAISGMFNPELKSIFSVETTDLERPPLKFRKSAVRKNQIYRWAHVDLGLTSDSAGICIGHISSFKRVQGEYGAEYNLPVITIDGVLEVPPQPGGSVPIKGVREIVIAAKKVLGLNVFWVSYDSYESAESLQRLAQLDFIADVKSVDRTTGPYDIAKQALLDGRIIAPYHKKLDDELRGLIFDTKKGKIDHPPHGSKDCADAWASVVHGLSTQAIAWDQHGKNFYSVPDPMRQLGIKTPERQEDGIDEDDEDDVD